MEIFGSQNCEDYEVQLKRVKLDWMDCQSDVNMRVIATFLFPSSETLEFNEVIIMSCSSDVVEQYVTLVSLPILFCLAFFQEDQTKFDLEWEQLWLGWNSLDQKLLCCIRYRDSVRWVTSCMHEYLSLQVIISTAFTACPACQCWQILSGLLFQCRICWYLFIWTFNFGCCDSSVECVDGSYSCLWNVFISHYFARKTLKKLPTRTWLIKWKHIILAQTNSLVGYFVSRKFWSWLAEFTWGQAFQSNWLLAEGVQYIWRLVVKLKEEKSCWGNPFANGRF